MYKILFACAGGLSSYTIVKSCERGAKAADVEVKVHAISVGSVEKELERMKDDQWEVIMIAPQVRFAIDKARIHAEKYNVPCELIPMEYYSPIKEKQLFLHVKKVIDDHRNK